MSQTKNSYRSSLVILALLTLLYFSYPYLLKSLFVMTEPPDWFTKVVQLLFVSGVGFLGYRLVAEIFRQAIMRANGREVDIIMFSGLLKVVVLVLWGLATLSLFFDLGMMLTAVGAFSGLLLGWALQAPISGIAAWVMIVLRRPFKIGDRISFPATGLIGDVLDIGMMYTTLNQVGGTVGTEEASGRTILVPNATLFGNVIVDFTQGGDKDSSFVLDEIVVRITYDSDWAEAEKILISAAAEVTKDIIKKTGVKPYVRSDFYDYGVWLRLRYMAPATERPKVSHEINRRIFDRVSESKDVDFAIPYVYSYKTAVNKEGENRR